MKAVRQLRASLLMLGLLSGCTNMPDIQNMAYVTTLGVDYVNDRWVSYAQIHNFTSLARTEQLEIGKAVPVWVGRGEGDTLTMALANTSTTSQMRLFWGHVHAVVLSERALRQDLAEVYAAINRYREVRYNVLVYGTKRKLTDILIQKSLLNLPPLDSIMFTATQTNSPRSFILPSTGNRIIANLNEPGAPGFIPSIDIEPGDWSEDKKSRPMFKISGAYFFQNNKMRAWMSEEDLRGMRWAMKDLQETPVRIPGGDSTDAVLMFSRPKLSITPIVKGREVYYDLRVRADGYVIELLEDVPLPRLKSETAGVIQSEIETTYRKAVAAKCDPFNLQEALYRKYPHTFRRLFEKQDFILKPDSLRNIQVEVQITGLGKYKGRVVK
ncbi:germination protein GerC [Paenibacillus sp. 32O-W]|uniref:Ger(x)C family spore germination protein n=1 Tax=Paenibacillus sp. 32O-W TaxID=1695218 RepID=UPI00071F286F|nr:Ger(x)C family spore germination protein [Paenibacillus sp. 32O-W]ALS25880.1 germination protein GerC [Paenibacillus sp. 32O-W]